MDFSLSEERQMLADTTNRFFRDHYEISTRHQNAALDEGFNRETWKQLADLGLIGALLPADVGGLGGLGEDIAVIFEALGRGLVVEPFLATGILGSSPIAIAGSADQKAALEEVIAGNTLLALAHSEPEGRYSLSHVATKASSDDQGWTLTGQKAVVINGDTADKLVVSARISGDLVSEDGIALFLVDAKAAGLSRRGYGTIDGGRAAEITLANVKVSKADLIGEAGQAFPIIEETLARGIVALCAEAVGTMEVAQELTLEYLKTRKQFGRTIGTFQVLQHRMVDLGLEILQSRSAVELAASNLEAGRVEREKMASAAKNLVGRATRNVAEETIQMHGGIAMTWEYSLPHYAKRMTMIDHQLGDTDFHLERFINFTRRAA